MSGPEDYTYPGSNVLKNRADIRDQGTLQRFERGVTAVRIQELREKPVQGDYGLQHLQDIHRQVFKDVYEWAGQIRQVDIAKGPAGDRTLFTFKEDIPAKGAEIKALIKDANNLRGLDREQFAGKMGEVYAAVNEMHPFREGNGRATREYMASLAKESGHSLDFTKVSRENWNDAAKQSARGNLEPIKEVFHEIITVDRAVAFDRAEGREGQREALAAHPELDRAFKQLYETQRDGGDVEKVRAELSRELHAGKIAGSDVTVDESRRVIDNAAKARSLLIRDSAALGGQFRGEVVAVSSHHAMLKVGDMVAVRYELSSLDRNIERGERLTIQHGEEQSKVYDQRDEPFKDRGRDSMQMERERTLSTP